MIKAHPEVKLKCQWDAEETPGLPTWTVVSITDPGVPGASLEPGWGAVLRLRFHDIEAEDEDDRFVAISWAQAKEIIRVLKTILAERQDGLLVHCWAGRSRSAAVARIAAEILKTDYPAGTADYNRTVQSRLWWCWLRVSPLSALFALGRLHQR